MDRYKPVDITKKAKALCKEFPISEEKPHPFALPHSHRIMEKDKNGATKRRDYRSGAVRKNEPERLKLKTMGTDGFAIGKQTVDLRYLEQLIDSEQTACLGMLLKYAVEHLVGRQTDNCRSRCTVTERTRNVRHAFSGRKRYRFRRLCHAAGAGDVFLF